MKKLFKLILSTSIVASTFSLSALARDFDSKNGLSKGAKIPTFELENNVGKKIKFDEHFKGKVLLLVLANYCNKDLAGVWTVTSYYRNSKNKNFAFPFIFSRRCVPGYVPDFFVSQSATSTADQVKFPYFLMDWYEDTFVKFKGSKEDPHVYVVDKNGVVRYKKILTSPFIPREELDQTIDELLKE